MIRKRHYWKFRGQSLELGPRTLLVGILNVTPDSFSDGGKYADPEAAAARALEIQEQGADIIDIGAESTRPGAQLLTEEQELHRLIPVLKRLRDKVHIPISVDTWKSTVAERALEYGAHIINDVSGLTWQPELMKIIRQYDAGLILSHMRGTPQTWAKLPPMRDVMSEIASEIEASLHRAVKAGIPADHIVIDPGIGFGKRKEQNSEILARLEELGRLPAPVLVGPSRKLFLAQETPEATEFATAAAITAAILNGARLVRVHDVLAMKAVIATADAVIAAIPERAEGPATRVARQDQTGKMRETPFGEQPPKRPVRPPVPRREQDRREEDIRSKPLFRERKEERPPEEPRPPFRREPRPDDRRGPRPSYGRGGRPSSPGDRKGRPSSPGDRSGRSSPGDRSGRSSPGDRSGRSSPPGERGGRTGKPFRPGQRPPGGGEDRPRGASGPPRKRTGPPRGGRPPGGGRPSGGGRPPAGGRRGPNTPPRRRG